MLCINVNNVIRVEDQDRFALYHPACYRLCVGQKKPLDLSDREVFSLQVKGLVYFLRFR